MKRWYKSEDAASLEISDGNLNLYETESINSSEKHEFEASKNKVQAIENKQALSNFIKMKVKRKIKFRTIETVKP